MHTFNCRRTRDRCKPKRGGAHTGKADLSLVFLTKYVGHSMLRTHDWSANDNHDNELQSLSSPKTTDF